MKVLFELNNIKIWIWNANPINSLGRCFTLPFVSSHLLYNPRKILHPPEYRFISWHSKTLPFAFLLYCFSVKMFSVFMAYSLSSFFFAFLFSSSSRNRLLLGSILLEEETFSRNSCFSWASKCVLYVTSFTSRCLAWCREWKGINGHSSVKR